MKTYIPYSLLAAAAACGMALGQTAYTTPVGYITHTIAPNSGFSSGADTYLYPSLIQPSAFAGVASSVPSGTATVQFSGSGVPANFDGTYVLEITNGNSEGWWSTIVSSTSSSITVSDAFPQGLAEGVSVSVRKHNTLKNFLGSNNPGVSSFDGETQNDEIQILDPVTQVVKAIAYVPAAVSGAAEDGWFDLGSSSSADDLIIEPGMAVNVKRFGATGLTFTSVGEVKTTKTQVDIYPSSNWLGTPFAVGASFNTMNLQTQLNIFNGESTDYDELQFLNPDQSAIPFAAVDPAFFGAPTIANLADSSDAGAVVFKEGTGIVLKRDSSKSATVLTIPGATIAP